MDPVLRVSVSWYTNHAEAGVGSPAGKWNVGQALAAHLDRNHGQRSGGANLENGVNLEPVRATAEARVEVVADGQQHLVSTVASPLDHRPRISWCLIRGGAGIGERTPRLASDLEQFLESLGRDDVSGG